MDRFKAGVVGLGGRGIYLAKQFNDHPETTLVAVCDTNSEALEDAKNEFKDTPITYYSSLDEMCEKEDLNIGVVASWDPAHKENTLTFLKHNLHVYLEKPMAQTIEDCDAILDGWQKSSASMMVGLELRYCTLFQKVRSLLDDDAIGDVKIATVFDHVSVGGQYYYHNNRRKKSFIKSLILEKGTHSLDLLNWFVGSAPIRVYCEGGLDVFGGKEANDKKCRDCAEKDTCHYFKDVDHFVMDYGATLKKTQDLCVWAEEVDVDDNAVVSIKYANGAKASYMECHFSPDYNRQFTLVGDKGKLDAFYNNEQEFVIHLHKRFTDKIETFHPPKAAGGHGGGDPRILKSFIDLVKRNAHECPGGVDARNSAAIAIAAAKSEEIEAPVTINEYVMNEG